jgi:DNA adenine methylase
MANIPTTIQTYVEPFIGGGSIFLEVLSERRAGCYLIADVNHHVIDMWRHIRNNYDQLVACLHDFKDHYDNLKSLDAKRECYYQFRQLLNSTSEDRKLLPVEVSAVFMILNKTAFNALVRYNGKGHFNSAFGKRNKVAMEFDDLDRLSQAMNEVEIEFIHNDFSAVTTVWRPGDFVYLDPPYHVLENRKVDDKTYSKNGFTDEDEKRLRIYCDEIDAAGATFLMSNHECPAILEYFAGYPYINLVSYKCFTGKASSRIETKEILLGNRIKNFSYSE